MSSVASLLSLFGYEVGDPNKDEIASPTGSTSQFIVWLNLVVQDIARLTDCFQTSLTVIPSDSSTEAFAIPISGIGYITIIDYVAIAAANSTVTVTVNGVATIKTADTDWMAVTSNAVTATNLAAALEAVTGLTASASGSVVTVRADSDSIYALENIATSGVATLLTVTCAQIWRIIRVTDKTNKRIYRSVTRNEYQGYYNNIVGNSLADVYVYNVFGYGANRKIYILPIVATASVITIEASVYPARILYNATVMPGILNNDDNILVKGLASLYWNAAGDNDRASNAFKEYFERLKRLASDVGINPVLKPEVSTLYSGATSGDGK